MALKIRVEPTVSAQQRMINHMRRNMMRHPPMPVIPDRQKALIQLRCYECDEEMGWVSEGGHFVCDACRAELAQPEQPVQPPEMVVRHVVQHVKGGDLDTDLIIH